MSVVSPLWCLGADVEIDAVTMCSPRGADRPGIQTCLQIGDAQRRVFEAPIRLIRVDPQHDPGSDDSVVRARPLWGRPLRQIARNPSFRAQPGAEVVIDVRFTTRRGRKAPREGRHEK